MSGKIEGLPMNGNGEAADDTKVAITEQADEDIPKHVPLAVWAVLFFSSFGVFMASVSTSALIIAFPVLLLELRMTINTMMWVLLVLLLLMGQ